MYVSLKQALKNKVRKKHEWMTNSTIKELKKRHRLWTKYKEFNSECNYKAYNTKPLETE